MEIVEVDVEDEGLLGDWYAVHERAETHERPFASPWRLPEVSEDLRNRGGRRRLLAFAGIAGGTVVCAGALSLPQLDNRSSCDVVVDTDPPLRRRGHGSQMLAHLEARAAAEQRSLLNAEAFYPLDGPADGAGQENVDFLTRRGYELGLGDVHRRLELPVDEALLDRLAAEAAPHHTAYRIHTWTGPAPDDLAASFAALSASLFVEAPTGGVEREVETADVSVLRDDEALQAAQGRTAYVAVALDRTGEVVAYTTVMTTAHEPRRCYQWGTVVSQAHRGHRLGVAVKVANLRQLQRGAPGLREQLTYNAEVNAHMVAINDALGFVPVERLGEFQKRLAQPSG